MTARAGRLFSRSYSRPSARAAEGEYRIGPVLPLIVALLAVGVGVLAGIDPRLAIGVALGLTFAGIVLANLTIGLALFVVLSFFEVLSSIGGSFGLTKVIGLLLAISWLAHVGTARSREDADFLSVHPVATYVLVLFVAWSALGLVWAEFPGETIESTYRYAQNALLFLIVFTAVRERRHAIWVTAAFVAGATVAAAFALANPVDPGQYDVARASGTVGDPNELAAVLVAGIILAGVLLLTVRRSPAMRVASFGCLLLCTSALVLSLSRGGLVALTVALIAGILFGGRWRGAVALVAVVAALSAVGYYTVVAPPEARERITTVDGGTGRTDIWTVGWRMVEDHPVRGIGSGNFPFSSIHYFLEPGALQYGSYFIDHPKVAHNTYLHVLAENGMIGLALLGGLVAFALGCAIKAARRFAQKGDRDMELLSRGVTLALFGLLAADFFLSGQFSKQLWFLLGMGPALLAISRTRAREGRMGSF